MEEWEGFLDTHSEPSSIKTIENAVHTAQLVLAEDLAPFEIDWFLESLLLKPVALLETVSSQRSEDAWSKLIIKAFTLLSDVVEKFDNAEPYYEDIELLCNLSYPALVRAKALACLSQLARRHRPSEAVARAQEQALALDDTCKAARCELLGVLCERHPELFQEVTSLWRTFINMLDSHISNAKMSLNVVKEVLLAVFRLFKHFGSELVVSEVFEFYEKMKVFINVPRCHEVCCRILENYSSLFREKVSADVKLRSFLWESLSKTTQPAVVAVYRTCFEDGTRLKVLVQELAEKSSSDRSLTRFTALRVLSEARAGGDLRAHVDVQQLERRLRDHTAHQHVEEISWCIRADVLNGDRLLQAALLHYDGLPAAARRQLVRDLLDAPAHVRTPAVMFLTAETCTAAGARRDLLLAAWRDLLAGDVTAPQHVVDDYLQHAAFLLDTFLQHEHEQEEFPPKLSELMNLTAHVLNVYEGGVRAVSGGALVRALLTCARTYPSASAVRALRAVAARGATLHGFYESIDLSSCDDEDHLLQLCEALLEAPPGAAPSRQVLLATKVLLSRSDTEPAVLSRAIKTLENLILSNEAGKVNEDGLNDQLLHEVIYLVENIRKLYGTRSKDHRILHRDAVMFLGKFGSTEWCDRAGADAVSVATSVRELSLNIPMEGTTLTLDLRDVLQRALAADDLDTLHTLLTIMCANFREPPSPGTADALCRVVAALSRRNALAARAASLCGQHGAHQLLAYAADETSPRGRRALLAAAGGRLARGPRLQAARLADAALAAAAHLHNASQAKLDLLTTLTSAMRENNMLAQKYLPRVIILILETRLHTSPAALEDASQVLVDKIGLFEGAELGALARGVVDGMCEKDFEINGISKKVLARAVAFLKKLFDSKRDELPDVMQVFERAAARPTPGGLHALSGMSTAFECDLPFLRKLLVRKDGFLTKFFQSTAADGSVSLDAVLYFMSTFCEVLLELHYEKALQKLSEVIESATPEHIIYAHKNLSACVAVVTRCLTHVPQAVQRSGGVLLRGLFADSITESLLAGRDDACAAIAEALTYVVDAFAVRGVPPAAPVVRAAADRLRHVRAIPPDDVTDRDHRTLSDFVHVALVVLHQEVIRGIVCSEDTEDTLVFFRTYISAFTKFFTRKPFVLLEEGWAPYALVLIDVVRRALAARAADVPTVLQLVDELWPAYEARSDLQQKYRLLLELSRCSPRPAAGSRPVRWALAALADRSTGPDDAIRLVPLLPGGDECRSAYVSFASAWPARLSEMHARAACALRALMDGCARTRDRELLALLARLAAGDSTKGWWDGAFDDCMKEVASEAQMELVEHVYRLSCGGRTAGACDQLLVPLLRYISPSLCEEFFSVYLEEIFSVLKKEPREGASSVVRQSCLTGYICAFNLLRIAFEKIPKQHIESPGSVLYSRMRSKCERPFFLAYTVCVRGAQLRAGGAGAAGAAGGDDALRNTYRVFHCAAYNCMAVALCCRGPAPAVYGAVLDPAGWRPLVDETVEYHLPVTENWKQHTTAQAVSIDISEGERTRSAGTASRTARTAHFLRTLSEDPLLYDIPEVEHESPSQEIQLVANPLNEHECAATLTALVRHAAARGGLGAPAALGAALLPHPDTPSRNLRWLLAQVICNCKEELKPYAAALRPGLLALVADTGANHLNGLHVEILNTVVDWREEESAEVDGEHVNTIVRALVRAGRGHAARRGLLAGLLDTLHKLTELYGSSLTVAKECCQSTGWVMDELSLKILKIFAKNKVDLRDVAEEVFAAHEQLETGAAAGAAGVAGRALGLAASALTARGPGQAAGLADRFRQLAARLRRAGRLQQYVRLVYYTQKEWPACCDMKLVRDVADLANKIPGGEKQKCLNVVAAYLEHAAPGEDVDALFDALDISQLVAGGEALTVAEKGLPLMRDGLRRRVTLQLAARAARPQLLAALEVALASSAPDEPPSKKRRAESALLSEELRPLVSAVALALTDETVPRVGALLSSDHALRWSEAFALATYFPLTSRRGERAACAHRTLQLFLQRARTHDAFRSARLREEPLDFGSVEESTSTGLFASASLHDQPDADVPGDAAIDVQMPLDDVLASILRFVKRHPAAASELCVQLGRSVAAPAGALCGLLHDLLQQRRAEDTPLVLQLCRLYVDGCCDLPGFPEAVEQLAAGARGREHRGLAGALRQDVRLRTAGPRLFVLGTDITNEEIEMPQVKIKFSITDLVASFGTLAHWEELTVRQRMDVASTLPVLWTDEATFRTSLELYEGDEGWFGAMLAVHRGAAGRGCSRRLGRADRWPRNTFEASAVAEALEWRYIRDVSRGEADVRRLAARPQRGQCLAAWAARLMLRRLFLETIEVESDSESSDKDSTLGRALSRSHQLQWCRRANEMELPAAALQCLQDVSGLYESETLPWMVQKMLALRAAGRLREALDLYESATQFRAAAAPEHALAAERCRLLLLADLGVLTPDKILPLRAACQSFETFDELELTEEAGATVDCIYQTVMACLYEHCAGDISLLRDMCGLLRVYRGVRGGARARPLADLLVRRAAARLPPDLADAVLTTLGSMKEDLDEFALDAIRSSTRGLPESEGRARLVAADESLLRARLMLSLVADPAHCLLHYCGGLLRAAQAHDRDAWARCFTRMTAKMFENPFAGPDYRVLGAHRPALARMQHYDESSAASRQDVLRQLMQELRAPAPRTLCLPQLCPALCGGEEGNGESARALRTLLRLPAGDTLHFDETVHVYTESIRRAARLTVYAGGAGGAGGVRRYIVKSGESLRGDAAALRWRAAVAAAVGEDARRGTGGYWVTPLSEDCGLIEYLEEHETVRSFLLSAADTDVEAVLSSAETSAGDAVLYRAAVEQFHNKCARVPATLLRRAMERSCASVDEFIRKKARLTDSLSTVTLVNWLLGVGDRHLENLLYGYRDGALCNIDWGAVGQHGRGELPCARLTRNLLAACDLEVLESRLQRAVRGVRAARAQLAAALHVAFCWREDFAETMDHTDALVRGAALPHHVTGRVLRASGGEHRDKLAELLDQVFQDIQTKEVYSVEEQVGCLLRQCTDPRVLAVTRSKWEPWL